MYKSRDKDTSGITMYQSENFAYTDKGALSSVVGLDDPDTYMDTRMYMISTHTNFKTKDWLINYLNTAAYFASKNHDAYPTYLCDLGYIPVVYLPTCVPTLGTKLMLILDEKNIPYIKVKGTSFIQKYFNTDITDAWVHKLDAAKILGCKPEAVRSADFVREVFNLG